MQFIINFHTCHCFIYDRKTSRSCRCVINFMYLAWVVNSTSVARTTSVHESVFKFLLFKDPTVLAWPQQTVSIFVLASRPLANFNVILTENLKPSPGLTLGMFEIHKPLQRAVFCPDNEVASPQVVTKAFYCFNDSKQFSACQTVLLLWPSQCTVVCNDVPLAILELRESLSTCISIEEKDPILSRVGYHWGSCYGSL